MYPNPGRDRVLAQAATQCPWFAGAVGDPDTPLLNLVACVAEGLWELDLARANRQADFLAYLVERAAWEATEPDARLDALQQILSHEEGYRGSGRVAAPPTETCLGWILEHRRGTAEVIAAIYLSVAHRLGWPLVVASRDGLLLVGFPEAERAWLSPGDPSLPPHLFAGPPCRPGEANQRGQVVSARGLVQRLLQAQQVWYDLHEGEPGRKLVAQKSLLLEPQDPERLRDLGDACCGGGEPAEAIACWRTYLEEVPDAPDRIMLLAAIAQLEGGNQ